MYAWIWRHLPFGLPGKIVGSLILLATAVSLLWFYGFPAAEPLLPFGDVQVGTGGGAPGQGPGGGAPGGGPGGGPGPVGPTPRPGESLPAADVIPYSTVTNNASPRPSR